DEMAAILTLGVATPAAVRPIEGDQLNLADLAATRRLRAEMAQRRAGRLASQAVDAVARALQGVADAVSRCEGSAADCADPARNPALGRAALAARQAGASDADIARVVAGETVELATLPEPRYSPM